MTIDEALEQVRRRMMRDTSYKNQLTSAVQAGNWTLIAQLIVAVIGAIAAEAIRQIVASIFG